MIALASAIPEIWMLPPQFKMGHVTYNHALFSDVLSSVGWD